MNVALWVAAGILAAVFLGAGGAKLTQPTEKLLEAGMGWVKGADPMFVKGLGLLEVLGAVGLILPPLINVLPGLAAWAAVGIALVMVGAIGVHARAKEFPQIGVNLALLALAVFVAWGRFGSYAF